MNDQDEKDKRDEIPLSKKWQALSRQLRKHRKLLLGLSLLGIFSALANGVVPLLVGLFLDAIITPSAIVLPQIGSVPLWIALLGTWVLAQMIANGTDWVIGLKSKELGLRIQAGYVVDAYSQLLRLPVSFFKQRKAGELSDLVSRTSWMMDTIVSSVMVSLAPQFLSIAVGIGIAYFLNPLLATVLLVGVALYVATMVRLLAPVAGLQAKGLRLWREASGDVHDAYMNLQMVKQAGTESFENERAAERFFGKGGAVPTWFKLDVFWNNIYAFQRVLIVATQLAVFIISVAYIFNGTMTIGELIAFNAYAGLIFGPFVALGSQWQTLQNGLTAAAQAEVIFETPTEVYEPESAPSLKDMRGSVSFEHVSFAYEPELPEILKDVSFTAEPGQVVALVGETGAGKSTLADLISGYYFPTKGTISVDGHDITTVSLSELRRQIAVVPQEVVLFNSTVLDNIRYGRPDATDAEVQEAARRAHAADFIERFPEKYQQLVGERGIKLSVGQKQRISIARAILRDPRILILDEPTSALDAETEQYITKSLGELMQGRTTFVIAHRLSTVREADLILVLKHGEIVERGTHEELIALEGGTYRHLYELHIGLHE